VTCRKSSLGALFWQGKTKTRRGDIPTERGCRRERAVAGTLDLAPPATATITQLFYSAVTRGWGDLDYAALALAFPNSPTSVDQDSTH
jgi:hypothetical protein